jgi:predicted DNA-binding transcriptional regulator AlpA
MTTADLLNIEAKLDALLRAVAERHLGRQELAERLGVSASTIDRRAAAGSIPRPINGRWLLSDVMAWEDQQAGRRNGAPNKFAN